MPCLILQDFLVMKSFLIFLKLPMTKVINQISIVTRAKKITAKIPWMWSSMFLESIVPIVTIKLPTPPHPMYLIASGTVVEFPE